MGGGLRRGRRGRRGFEGVKAGVGWITNCGIAGIRFWLRIEFFVLYLVSIGGLLYGTNKGSLMARYYTCM